jgi:hypothetical protein
MEKNPAKMENFLDITYIIAAEAAAAGGKAVYGGPGGCQWGGDGGGARG